MAETTDHNGPKQVITLAGMSRLCRAARALLGSRTKLLGDLSRQRLIRWLVAGNPPQLERCLGAAVDRSAAMTGRSCDRTPPLTPRNPAQYLKNFPHPPGRPPVLLLLEGNGGPLRVIAGVA